MVKNSHMKSRRPTRFRTEYIPSSGEIVKKGSHQNDHHENLLLDQWRHLHREQTPHMSKGQSCTGWVHSHPQSSTEVQYSGTDRKRTHK